MKRKREKDNKGNALKKMKINLTADENERFEEVWKFKRDNVFQILDKGFVGDIDGFKKGLKELAKKLWYEDVRGTVDDRATILKKKLKSTIEKIHAPFPQNLKRKEDFIIHTIERMDCISKCHKICYDLQTIGYEKGCFEKLKKSLDIAMEDNSVSYNTLKKTLIEMIENF